MKKKKNQHGGAREGAGRPKGEPTKVKRIPTAIEPAVDKLIEQHQKKV